MFSHRPDYNSPQYKSWRFGVFKRDNWTCVLCHRNGVELNAHHIIRWADAPQLRYVNSNGVTLCKDCHESKVNGHEDAFITQFKEIVGQRKIQSTLKREERTGRKKKPRPKYKPRNPNTRW
jgi:formate-dependent nitrite reductase cytochrome c552 subunit